MGEVFSYLAIVALMALESSFFPFPSEVVIPPAGYLASLGRLNLVMVILSGILGSVLGALFNYYLAYRWGRRMVLNIGERFGLSLAKLSRVEDFFARHGHITTFIGRLIPGVRQYISLPAGLGKMDLVTFLIYTALGAGIWVTILAWIGYYVGNNREIIHSILKRYYLGIVLLVLGLVWSYQVYRKWIHGKSKG